MSRPGSPLAPKAFLDIDENSLVVSIGPNIPVKQIVADLARPAGMIYYNDKNESVRWPDGSMDRITRSIMRRGI